MNPFESPSGPIEPGSSSTVIKIAFVLSLLFLIGCGVAYLMKPVPQAIERMPIHFRHAPPTLEAPPSSLPSPGNAAAVDAGKNAP